MDGQPITYRSVSQINSYNKCPYRYYLERVVKAWQRPAAWSPQGTAVHYAVEMWEKSDREADLDQMKTWFLESYSDEINKLSTQTPNMDFWFASGPYRGMTDVVRRRDIGLTMVETYRNYRLDQDSPGWYNPIYVGADGTRFVEQEFSGYIGDVPVRGFVDQVEIIGEGHQLRVVDVKSGKDPGDELQLKVYQIMMRKETGMKIPKGAYWMAKSGKAVEFDLEQYPDSVIEDEFGAVDSLIKAQEFDARPEKKKCMFCSVASSCEYKEV